MSAEAALTAFSTRKLSPVEFMTAIIDRVERLDAEVNALPIRFFEPALAAAGAAEKRYMGRGQRPRPLEGLPVAVKDDIPIAGQPWTMGSLVYRDRIADETAPVGERVIESGAIIHARSTMPEFAMLDTTFSRLWGVTRNPWNLSLGPGGSSGGSAAALAAGLTTLAVGSDIGGSIRMPAAFCGLIGYKPPYGRVPLPTNDNFTHYQHHGPIGRTVGDVRLLENAIAGPHPRDALTVRPKVTIPARLPGIKGWRIALSIDLGGYTVADEVRHHTMNVAEWLTQAGASVNLVTLKWSPDEVAEACAAHYALLWHCRPPDDADRDLFSHYVVDVLDGYRAPDPISFRNALAAENRAYLDLARIFADHRVLVCPTYGMTGIPAELAHTDGGYHVDGNEVDPSSVLLTAPFNMCSRCPVLSVPSGIAGNGLPTGVQIVGPTYDDVSVFRVAASLQQRYALFESPTLRPALI